MNSRNRPRKLCRSSYVTRPSSPTSPSFRQPSGPVIENCTAQSQIPSSSSFSDPDVYMAWKKQPKLPDGCPSRQITVPDQEPTPCHALPHTACSHTNRQVYHNHNCESVHATWPASSSGLTTSPSLHVSMANRPQRIPCSVPLATPPKLTNGFDDGFNSMDGDTDDQGYTYGTSFPSSAKSTCSSVVNLSGKPNDSFSSCSSAPTSPAVGYKSSRFSRPLSFHLTTPSSHRINSSAAQAAPKRPRGRPRKPTTAAALRAMNPPLTRSKTGCQTCRKRKKKCDEAKPKCNNCQKNGLICEGYSDKRLWDSAKIKKIRGSKEPLIDYALPPFLSGVVTVEDNIFWQHYNKRLCDTFTVEGYIENGFRALLVPPALQYEGLMKAILYLSSVHLDFDTPDGIRILGENPKTSLEALHARSHEYYDRIGKLTDSEASYIETAKKECIQDEWYHAKYGQKLCLLLACMLHGSTDGSHREHLRMYMKMYKAAVPKGDDFHAFSAELFQYYIFADELMRHPRRSQPLNVDPQWKLPIEISSPRLIGIEDGLLSHLPKINNIRDSVRRNMEKHGEARNPGYDVMWETYLLYMEVDKWKPTFPTGDKRNLVVKIYRDMMWVYLSLTHRLTRSKIDVVTPSLRHRNNHVAASDSGYSTMHQDVTATHNVPYSSALDSPPGLDYHVPHHRGSFDLDVHGSMPSTPRHKPIHDTVQPRNMGYVTPSSYMPCWLATAAMPQQAFLRDYQPMMEEPEKTPDEAVEQRRVLRFDDVIVKTVDSALESLGQIKASEPVQVLLLIPCLLLGVAAIEPRQREKVEAAIKRVRGYTGRKTCDSVLTLVQQVWQHMDEGNWWLVWDWQQVACDLNLDFLPA